MDYFIPTVTHSLAQYKEHLKTVNGLKQDVKLLAKQRDRKEVCLSDVLRRVAAIQRIFEATRAAHEWAQNGEVATEQFIQIGEAFNLLRAIKREDSDG